MIAFLGALVGKWHDYVPHVFFLTASSGKIKLNVDRIIEAIVIGVILAAILGWAVNPRLERLENMMSKMYDDLYQPTTSVPK